jgi:hypothetical protein
VLVDATFSVGSTTCDAKNNAGIFDSYASADACMTYSFAMDNAASGCCSDGLSACDGFTSASDYYINPCSSEDAFSSTAMYNAYMPCEAMYTSWGNTWSSTLEEQCAADSTAIDDAATKCCTDAASVCDGLDSGPTPTYAPTFIGIDNICYEGPTGFLPDAVYSGTTCDDIRTYGPAFTSDDCPSRYTDLKYYASTCCNSGESFCKDYLDDPTVYNINPCADASAYDPRATYTDYCNFWTSQGYEFMDEATCASTCGDFAYNYYSSDGTWSAVSSSCTCISMDSDTCATSGASRFFFFFSFHFFFARALFHFY